MGRAAGAKAFSRASVHVLEADAQIIPAGNDRQDRRAPQRHQADQMRDIVQHPARCEVSSGQALAEDE